MRWCKYGFSFGVVHTIRRVHLGGGTVGQSFAEGKYEVIDGYGLVRLACASAPDEERVGIRT